jgi:hypothetical protein
MKRMNKSKKEVKAEDVKEMIPIYFKLAFQ